MLRPFDAGYRPVVSAAGGARLFLLADHPPFCPYCVSRFGDRTALSTLDGLPAEPVWLGCPSAPPSGDSSPILADVPPPVCPGYLKAVSTKVIASIYFKERLSCHVLIFVTK